MRKARVAMTGTVVAFAFGVVFACTGGDPRPTASGSTDNPGDASKVDVEFTLVDAGHDAFVDDSGEAPEEDAGPAICQNGVKDSTDGETDVDCGGTICPKCVDKKKCLKDADCAGGACLANPNNGNQLECKTPKCDDGDRDGLETDIDCGGGTCAKCSLGKACNGPTDCASGVCTNATCACPADMQVVPKANGGAYCIDRTEVSKGQYNHFLIANIPVTSQIAVCQANGTFSPREAWPPSTTPKDPPNAMNGLAYSMAMPVHYVDWCDAYAYCKWSNKQLCGGQDGKHIAVDQLTNAGTDAWYNACATQGANTYPYGNSFDAVRCNGTGPAGFGHAPDDDAGLGEGSAAAGGTDFGFGYHDNYDANVWAVNNSDDTGNFTVYANVQCQGGVVGIYQMSGNLAEWEDSCGDGDTQPDGGSPATSAAVTCRLRGGSYGAHGDSEQLKCGADRIQARIPAQPSSGADDPLADVGIRCCLY